MVRAALPLRYSALLYGALTRSTMAGPLLCVWAVGALYPVPGNYYNNQYHY